jgi:hypothetical protein
MKLSKGDLFVLLSLFTLIIDRRNLSIHTLNKGIKNKTKQNKTI